MKRDLSEQERIRREKREQIKSLGISPYPQSAFDITCHSKDTETFYQKEELKEQEQKTIFQMAGRIVSVRNMGKASFAVIQDVTGRTQIYVRRESICSEDDFLLYDTLWKTLIDIGDIVGVSGFLFKTKMGEISLHVKKFTLLSKAIKPLPIVKEVDGTLYDQVSDAEFKYRQRYAHLAIEPSEKNRFVARSKIVNCIRAFYDRHNMTEVETPILQPIPGGASARPFVTHHNTLDIPLYLRIANELYLKRLLVGGFEAVYEFARDFRNEGMDRTHNPEFTILEMYIAYKDYFWMMDNTEKLLAYLAQQTHNNTTIPWGDNQINVAPPYQRITFYEALHQHTGHQMQGLGVEQLREVAQKLGVEKNLHTNEAQLLDELFSMYCEPKLIQPTFVMDYPKVTSPLTKEHRSNSHLVERFELYINGKEIANAYTELNDPIEQRKRFEEQARFLHEGDDEAMHIDQDFLRALEYGMPPCSGIGIGIDRLVMLLTNQQSIQDVILFPQMRPEK